MWYFTVHKISERVLIASSLGNMSPHITWDLKQNWWMEQAFKYWFCLGSYQHVCVQCRDGVFHVGLELMHSWWEKSSFVRDIVSNKTFAILFGKTLSIIRVMMILLLLTTGYHIGEKKLSLENTVGRPSNYGLHTLIHLQSVRLSLSQKRSEVEQRQIRRSS